MVNEISPFRFIQKAYSLSLPPLMLFSLSLSLSLSLSFSFFAFLLCLLFFIEGFFVCKFSRPQLAYCIRQSKGKNKESLCWINTHSHTPTHTHSAVLQSSCEVCSFLCQTLAFYLLLLFFKITLNLKISYQLVEAR